MSKPENPAAFPSNEKNGDGTHYHSHDGMTLRDWFAGQALAGQLANPAAKSDGVAAVAGLFAQDSYALADAMLLERAKGCAVKAEAADEAGNVRPRFIAWCHATFADGDIVEVREPNGHTHPMKVGSVQFKNALREMGPSMPVRPATAEQCKGWEPNR